MCETFTAVLSVAGVSLSPELTEGWLLATLIHLHLCDFPAAQQEAIHGKLTDSSPPPPPVMINSITAARYSAPCQFDFLRVMLPGLTIVDKAPAFVRKEFENQLK